MDVTCPGGEHYADTAIVAIEPPMKSSHRCIVRSRASLDLGPDDLTGPCTSSAAMESLATRAARCKTAAKTLALATATYSQGSASASGLYTS